jgi:hypothetical protein
VDINSARKIIIANIGISAKEIVGYYELKKQGFTKLLHRRKLQWLQNLPERNWYNVNDVRRKASRNFRNKKREYLKDRINYLATNNENKNIIGLYREINVFKRGYQPTK